MENDTNGVKNPKIKDNTAKPIKKMRQIIIETDGNNIDIIKAEVSGSIELLAILQNLIGFINNSKSKAPNGK